MARIREQGSTQEEDSLIAQVVAKQNKKAQANSKAQKMAKIFIFLETEKENIKKKLPDTLVIEQARRRKAEQKL